MSRRQFGEIPSLSPLDFFAPVLECHKIGKHPLKKYCLPFLGEAFLENEIVAVYLGYQEEGLWVRAHFLAAQKEQKKKENLELFIDTRNIKTKGYITRTCHHFVFSLEAACGREVTQFFLDDMHPLCDSSLLKVAVAAAGDGMVMDIDIPAAALYGFDASMGAFGFTYRAGSDRAVQHFACSSEEMAIEKRPDMWAEMRFAQ